MSPIVLKPGETPAVYVDVDGTLLLWPGENPGHPGKALRDGIMPPVNVRLVEALRAWHRAGKVLVIWSRGGIPHSELAARLTGLTPDACLPKPRLCIDDGPRSLIAGDRKSFRIIGPNDGLEELASL